MKKFTLILFSLCSISSFAQIPMTGLIGYYPFTGNANDVSGGLQNGTVMGATLTNDRFGNPNAAYNFAGNDYISVPAANFINRANYTYSVWAKPTIMPSPYFGVIYSIGGSSNLSAGDGYDQILFFNNSSQFVGYSYNYGFPVSSYTTSPAHSLNQWYHLVVTRDDSIVNLYVDNILVVSSTVSNTYGLTPHYGLVASKSMNIGGRCFLDPLYFFTGDIDDLVIYDYALTPAEVTVLYNFTGIEDANTLANNVSVYPNPTANNFMMSFPATTKEISISNSLGQLIHKESVSGITSLNFEIATNGIYFIQFKINNQMVTKKLIVSHH
jgi:Concanavalin A-like lectin/glucanases superfamily/Secretion system C-terminal sorting domain